MEEGFFAGFGPNDVLNGRTKLSFNHIGNRRFRQVVARSVEDYNNSTSRREKHEIVETIMEEIAESGGRFLKLADENGVEVTDAAPTSTSSWVELDAHVIKAKIAHAIRDYTKKQNNKLENARNGGTKKKRRSSSITITASSTTAANTTSSSVNKSPDTPASTSTTTTTSQAAVAAAVDAAVIKVGTGTQEEVDNKVKKESTPPSATTSGSESSSSTGPASSAVPGYQVKPSILSGLSSLLHTLDRQKKTSKASSSATKNAKDELNNGGSSHSHSSNKRQRRKSNTLAPPPTTVSCVSSEDEEFSTSSKSGGNGISSLMDGLNQYKKDRRGSKSSKKNGMSQSSKPFNSNKITNTKKLGGFAKDAMMEGGGSGGAGMSAYTFLKKDEDGLPSLKSTGGMNDFGMMSGSATNNQFQLRSQGEDGVGHWNSNNAFGYQGGAAGYSRLQQRQHLQNNNNAAMMMMAAQQPSSMMMNPNAFSSSFLGGGVANPSYPGAAAAAAGFGMVGPASTMMQQQQQQMLLQRQQQPQQPSSWDNDDHDDIFGGGHDTFLSKIDQLPGLDDPDLIFPESPRRSNAGAASPSSAGEEDDMMGVAF